MPRKLAETMIERIQSMGEQGYTQTAIRDETGCTIDTIRKYLREKNIDNYHKGGVISKKIMLTPGFETKEKKVEKKPDPNVIIADQKITLVGLLTSNKYSIGLHEENLSAEGEDFCCTVKLVDLPDLAKELMEVYQAAVKMKKGE